MWKDSRRENEADRREKHAETEEERGREREVGGTETEREPRDPTLRGRDRAETPSGRGEGTGV